MAATIASDTLLFTTQRAAETAQQVTFTNGPLDWLVGLIGAVLILIVVMHIVRTLVAPWGSNRRRSHLYELAWRLWRRGARRRGNPSEAYLAAFGPIFLISMLVAWLTLLMVGWAGLYWPWRQYLDGVSTGWDGVAAVVYYSGVILCTLGLGDIRPTASGLRLLTVMEAVNGLATISLVISFLPALYASYSRREARLVMLNDFRGAGVGPGTLTAAVMSGNGPDRIYDWLGEWSMWIADVLESHTSYPVLAFFRSPHRGQSWVTGLGLVLDAAALVTAVMPGADKNYAPRQVRALGASLLDELAGQLRLTSVRDDVVDRDVFKEQYDEVAIAIASMGIKALDEGSAWKGFIAGRSAYGPRLVMLCEFLRADQFQAIATATGSLAGAQSTP